MDRRTALQQFGAASLAVLGGCSQGSTNSDTSDETIERDDHGNTTDEDQELTEPNLSTYWTYDGVDSGVKNIDITGDLLYIYDVDQHLHQINLDTGKREWYLSDVPNVEGVLSSGDGPILANNDPSSLYGYSATGERQFEIGPSDLNRVQRWSELPLLNQAVVMGASSLYVAGLVYESQPPSCYTVKVDTNTGSLSGGARWHTAGRSSLSPNNDIVVGGWRHFPSYIEKINEAGESIWATSIDIRNYTRVDNIQTDSSGNIYVEVRTEESAGVIALHSDGTVKWKHQQRGSPKQTYRILNRTVITENQVIIPYVPNPGRPTEIKLIALDKQDGKRQHETLLESESGTRSFAPTVFSIVSVGQQILVGFREGSSPLWRVVELPDLSKSGDINFSENTSDIIRKVSDSSFLSISGETVSLVGVE
ncbi:PQQ-binding-like beta-propeller repeat protein [Halorubrum ezzemoulense]|uniref:outer membrane protein assembly factor BamB family protein n=1 Tax=Halorubrum ezzemoulense TaxID=337243 RepID=UPI00232B7647|nr:PQQ-binding-like beta-propeller repeat protein [Halorubrum ezzemoulense]MDB2281136.1 PQQ-binding-like beta-propeller repeat protein [Halorubrum ezzemoulense]